MLEATSSCLPRNRHKKLLHKRLTGVTGKLWKASLRNLKQITIAIFKICQSFHRNKKNILIKNSSTPTEKSEALSTRTENTD
jgi:hypothetical protein